MRAIPSSTSLLGDTDLDEFDGKNLGRMTLETRVVMLAV
jgi:hypothetical protein